MSMCEIDVEFLVYTCVCVCSATQPQECVLTSLLFIPCGIIAPHIEYLSVGVVRH